MWVGLIQSVEGLKRTKTDLPQARGILHQIAFTLAAPLALLSLQPAGPHYRFWTCQPPYLHEPIPYDTSFSWYIYTQPSRSVSLENPDWHAWSGDDGVLFIPLKGQTLPRFYGGILWRHFLDSKYETIFLFTLPPFCSGFSGSWPASLILSIDEGGKVSQVGWCQGKLQEAGSSLRLRSKCDWRGKWPKGEQRTSSSLRAKS